MWTSRSIWWTFVVRESNLKMKNIINKWEIVETKLALIVYPESAAVHMYRSFPIVSERNRKYKKLYLFFNSTEAFLVFSLVTLSQASSILCLVKKIHIALIFIWSKNNPLSFHSSILNKKLVGLLRLFNCKWFLIFPHCFNHDLNFL